MSNRCPILNNVLVSVNEPPRDKTNNVAVRPAKTQISLGIHPVWSESSLSAWRKLGSLPSHWAHSEDSDQTGRMPWLIWVFAGRTLILLVLSWGGSNINMYFQFMDPFKFNRSIIWIHISMLVYYRCFDIGFSGYMSQRKGPLSLTVKKWINKIESTRKNCFSISIYTCMIKTIAKNRFFFLLSIRFLDIYS